jgi:hypothetical protein
MHMLTTDVLRWQRESSETLSIARGDQASYNVIDVCLIMALAAWLQRFACNDKEGGIGSTLAGHIERAIKYALPARKKCSRLEAGSSVKVRQSRSMSPGTHCSCISGQIPVCPRPGRLTSRRSIGGA